MIHIKVGLALKITDGYTGEPADNMGFDITVDGIQRSYIRKPGGYVVFSGVPAGQHSLVIRNPFFITEELSFETGGDLIPIVLKPASCYPYGRNAAKLRLNNAPDSPEELLWVGQIRDDTEIKIAQSGLKEGDSEIKLFFEGRTEKLPLPGYFLISDGENSEVCMLDDLKKDENSFVSEPLKSAHKRGCSLYPVLMYRAAAGSYPEIIFREKTDVCIWAPKAGKLSIIDMDREEYTV